MLFGANPLVSITQLDPRNPVKRLKEAKARGLKLIVIDPRRTETARYADVFVQPLPGHDAAIAASMLRIIMAEGWHDAAFCAQHVADLDLLREAVEPFTVEYVSGIAGVTPRLLREAAEAYGSNGTRNWTRVGWGRKG